MSDPYFQRIVEYRFGDLRIAARGQDVGILNGILVEDEYALLPIWSAKKEVKTIVDVGAHVGGFSLQCTRLWPHAEILAFEPHPVNFDLLKQNCKPFPNIHPQSFALGGQSGPVEMLDRIYINSGGSSIPANYLDLANPLTGVSLMVEQIAASEAFHQADILKLDCEGSEFAIVKSLRDAGHMPNIGWIRGEYHYGIESLRRFLELFSPTHEVSIQSRGDAIGMFIAHRREG